MSLYSASHDTGFDPAGFLKKIPLFRSLGAERLSMIAGTLHRRQFAAGVTLFHQDMPGMMLYMVEEGHIRVYSQGRTGQELTFEIFGPGDIFGELSILDNKSHTATAITLSPAVIWLMPKSVFDELLDTDLQTSREMIRILVNRIRSRALYTEVMTFQDVQGRLAHSLANLAERYGKPTERGLEIEVPLTQVDLSAMIGVTRESVNKALSSLRAAQLVQIDGNRISVLNMPKLKQMVQDRGR